MTRGSLALFHGHLWPESSEQTGTSRRRVAAVQEDGLARHEVRRRRREIDGERADLLGTPCATRGDIAKESVGELWILGTERGSRHVGREPARRDRVDLHVVSRPLDAEGAR